MGEDPQSHGETPDGAAVPSEVDAGTTANTSAASEVQQRPPAAPPGLEPGQTKEEPPHSGSVGTTKKRKPSAKEGEPKSNDPVGSKFSRHERGGEVILMKLTSYIQDHNGQYLRDEDGSLCVLLDGNQIPLNFDRNNYSLADLMLKAAHVSTLSPAAQVAIQRLQVRAAQRADRVRSRSFSALSNDGGAVYIPVDDGQLLRISAEGRMLVPNGRNEDSTWVKHPLDDPLKYTRPDDPKLGLDQFEKLLVQPLACRERSMAWLLAMHEGLFPYVRDLAPARFIPVHIGRTQQGKTSGAQRFTLLHGLGNVLGDFSVAALWNLPDRGLLVMDNIEQANLVQGMIDFLLLLSTGASHGRSTTGGKVRMSNARPAAVVTSIEGLTKEELRKRSVEVEFVVGDSANARRGPIEGEITKQRHRITSALTQVLQRFFQIRKENRSTPKPLAEFEEHFDILADLLRAYGDVAGKPPKWSESLIASWAEVISSREPSESELEQPVMRVLLEDLTTDVSSVTYQGQDGKLFVRGAGQMLTALQDLRLPNLALPRSPQGLGRRLRSESFRGIKVLDYESAPEFEQLRKQATRRPIGFFVPDNE